MYNLDQDPIGKQMLFEIELSIYVDNLFKEKFTNTNSLFYKNHKQREIEQNELIKVVNSFGVGVLPFGIKTEKIKQWQEKYNFTDDDIFAMEKQIKIDFPTIH